MRHGDAPSAKTDRERMLSDLGKQQCRNMAEHLSGFDVKKLISSDYQRAIDSAEIICSESGVRVSATQSELLRPMANPKDALNFIADKVEETEEGACTLVVCHMPLISELASFAIDGNLSSRYSFPCASIIAMETDFAAEGCFQKLWQQYPE
jgi:phosphohistidine phosphatase